MLGELIKPLEVVAWLLGLLVIAMIDSARGAQHRRLLVLDRSRKVDPQRRANDYLPGLELFDKSEDEDLMPEQKPDLALWRQDFGDASCWRKSA